MPALLTLCLILCIVLKLYSNLLTLVRTVTAPRTSLYRSLLWSLWSECASAGLKAPDSRPVLGLALTLGTRREGV